MSNKIDAILAAALELTDEERIELADRLMSTVSGEYQREVDAAWAEEVDRRAREIDEGKVKLIDGNEFMAKLRRHSGH